MSATAILSPAELKRWVKRRESPVSRAIYGAAKSVRTARVLWWTPLLLSKVETRTQGLQFYSGMPQIIGALKIRLGRDVRLSGLSTLIGRSSTVNPELIVGDNVDIGWGGHDLGRHAGRNRRQRPPGRPLHAGRFSRSSAGRRRPRRRRPRSGHPQPGARQITADLIVFGEDWGSHRSSTQHLIRHMPGERRMLWVNSIGLRRPRLGMADVGRAARKIGAALRPAAGEAATRADATAPGYLSARAAEVARLIDGLVR